MSITKDIDIPKEQLKLLFGDVLFGYSTIRYNNQPVKVKHLSQIDIVDFDIKYNEYFEYAKNFGAPTIKDREQFLLQEGSWTSKKTKEIEDNQRFLINLRETKAKIFRQAEIDQINKTVKEIEDKIRVLENERQELLQCTAESFAQKKITEYQIFKSLLLDDRPLFTEKQFEELSHDDLTSIVLLYNSKFVYFNERTFKRIALSNFFLNSFYLCKDNPFTFYGKPIINLTMFQVEVFSHAVYFKHILSNSPNKPPQEVMEDPDKLIDWYNAGKSIKELTDKGTKPENITGLTSKDRDLLGIKAVNPHEKLIAAAQKKGGPLSASEIMRIQGVM